MDSNNQGIEKTSSPITTLEFVASFVAVLAVVTLVSIYIRRKRLRGNHDDRQITYYDDDDDDDDVAAIDGEAIEKFPRLLYSQAKLVTKSDSCSVCLGDYRDTDMLRLLPDCGHVFHLKCVDSWLRLRATCPLCRTLPNSNAVAVKPVGGDTAVSESQTPPV